jgi:exodeoxyribonuclease VII large subunit
MTGDLRRDGIPGNVLRGPFPVGSYAAALRDKLRDFARVQVFGEVVGFKAGRAKVWFELRDASGALPCSMWAKDWDALGLGRIADGTQVVVAGGCDFYPGSRTSSPAFSFVVDDVRIAGEGDLLAQLAQLRRRLEAEGVFEPQKRLPRPGLPRCIGVVTGEHGKARDDVLAALRRRGWAGRLVWAFAPVQDRHAAGAVTRALQDLAACEEVEVIVVARGGGSLADLFAFCDETLCRTVALLRVPVISSVGHHTDRTLIDDVAAVCCSTPTHAIEEAVRVDVADQHVRLAADAARLCGRGREAGRGRARHLAAVARALGHHTEGQRRYLHQKIREIRASSSRVIARDAGDGARRALVLARKRRAALHAAGTAGDRTVARAAVLERHSRTAAASRSADLRRIAQTLAAHDPDRVLERGYAIVTDAGGEEIVTAAAEARRRERLRVRFSDDDVLTEVIDDD